MYVTFLDILLIINIAIGLLLLMALQFIISKNNKANQILQSLVLIAILMLSVKILAEQWSAFWFIKYGFLVDSCFLFFGPLLYFYVKKLLFKPKNNKFSLVHLLPGFCYFLFSIFYFLIYDLTTNIEQTGILFFIVETSIILSISIYLMASYSILKKFNDHKNQELSFNQENLKFLNLLLISTTIFLILWIFSFLNSKLHLTNITIIGYNLMWLACGVQIYIIAFYALKQPEIFRVQILSSKKSKSPRIREEEIILLKERIENAIEKELIFLTSDLTLNDFSKFINTSPNNLSWLLNNSYNKSFYEFINEYRVQYFLNKIKNNEHKKSTFFALALDSGFNSKSTFYKAFKSVTSLTPSQYIKNSN